MYHLLLFTGMHSCTANLTLLSSSAERREVAVARSTGRKRNQNNRYILLAVDQVKICRCLLVRLDQAAFALRLVVSQEKSY